MVRISQVATVAGTFAVAMGIGFFMQNGDAQAARSSQEAVRPPIDLLSVAHAMPRITPSISIRKASEPQHRQLRSGRMIVVPTFTDAPESDLPSTVEAVISRLEMDKTGQNLILASAGDAECTIDLAASISDGAMVDLALSAPCHSDQSVTFYHEGLLFGGTVAADGSLSVQVPALSTDGVFIATMADGDGAVVRAQVPELVNFHRAVVQWTGDAAFELHALAGSADYGQPGHVWAESSDGEGHVDVIGGVGADQAYWAQIYTVARSSAADIHLTVETQISDANCGQPVTAQTLQLENDLTLKAQAVELVMPDCAANGDYLVLHNMLEDLKLASQH